MASGGQIEGGVHVDNKPRRQQLNERSPMQGIHIHIMQVVEEWKLDGGVSNTRNIVFL